MAEALTRFACELRAERAGEGIRGHAAVFGEHAQLPGHLERLAPTAFRSALAAADLDVVALFNHDASLLLGRTTSGTLRVGTDSRGLEFEVAKLPNTSAGRDVRELVERGDITGASFGFIPDEDEWDQVAGRSRRTHTSVARLVDVSPVTHPAYSGASTHLRWLDLSAPAESVRSQLIRARARVALEGV